LSSSKLKQTDDTTAIVPAPPGGDVRVPPNKSMLGRYLVIAELGRGGMGVVVHAYDPKLQRELALKMLRHDVMSDEARIRMLREARAMAKLNHPNVVAVYDVSLEDEVLTLAMEYVPGATMRDWLRDRPRSPAEIVDVFVQAGRGLAAAHAEGLLHRDFKPANVLVRTGEDGRLRVKVTDFGIALLKEAPELPSSAEAMAVLGDTGTGALTEVGAVMGTPRYMAPEQHTGGALGPAVDQYAFCVALWEALVGEVPFGGNTMAEDKRNGPPSWPGGVTAPVGLVATIRRGLAAQPEDRFANMDALLQALAASRKRGRPWMSVVALGSVVGVAGAGWVAWRDHRAERCTGAEAQLADAWDPGRRAEVEAALLATHAAYAPALWERLGPRLDSYADGWVAMHTEACTATSVRGEQSTAVLDLRMGCLFRAKRELHAAASLLGHADADVLRKAHVLVDGLPDLSRCSDVDALRAEVSPPSSDEAEAVARVEAIVAEARALRRAGKIQDANAALARADVELADIAYEPVASAVEHERGTVLAKLGKYADAEAAFRRVIALAGPTGDWKAVGGAAGDLAGLLATLGHSRTAEASVYLEFAQIVADRDLDPMFVSALHGARGTLLDARAQYAEAEAEFRAGMELRVREFGADHMSVAALRSNVATELFQLGKYAEAEQEHRAVLRIRETNLGPEHPEVGNSHHNLAAALGAAAKYDEAISHYREGALIWERAFGRDHPDVAKSRANLAHVLIRLGRYAEAEALLHEVVRTWSAAIGVDHPDIAVARANLAMAYLGLSRFEEAEAEARVVLRLQEQHARGHPELASAHDNLGLVLHATKRHVEAEAEFRTAIAIWTEVLGADHDETARGRSNLADALMAQERHREAEAGLQLALAGLRARVGPDHPDVAIVRRRLAIAWTGLERWDDAEAEFRLALAILERGRASDPQLVETQLRYGAFLRERGELDEARAQLEKARTGVGDDARSIQSAETAFELARVLRAQGERTRARALASEAERAFARAGPPWQTDRDAVAAWMRAPE